jgi:hypothetical protein
MSNKVKHINQQYQFTQYTYDNLYNLNQNIVKILKEFDVLKAQITEFCEKEII